MISLGLVIMKNLSCKIICKFVLKWNVMKYCICFGSFCGQPAFTGEINESWCVHVQVRKLWSLRCETRQQSDMSPPHWRLSFQIFFLFAPELFWYFTAEFQQSSDPPAFCLHVVWKKAGGDVSFTSAALAGDRVSSGDPAAWKKSSVGW